MLILLVVILITATICSIIGVQIYNKKHDRNWLRESQVWLITILCCLSVFALLMAIFVSVDVVKSKYVDEKIVMYEEENAKIEENINIMVENYMAYETETYGQFKSDNINGIAMIQLYPELKSDELVKQQIQIHTLNNNKIKELKEQQIDYKSAKWWLYFGG